MLHVVTGGKHGNCCRHLGRKLRPSIRSARPTADPTGLARGNAGAGKRFEATPHEQTMEATGAGGTFRSVHRKKC